MAKNQSTPSYLLYAEDDARRAEWMRRLRRHGAVKALGSADEIQRELERPRPNFISFIVDSEGDGRTIQRILKAMRRSNADAPGLLMSEAEPRSPEIIEGIGFRHASREAPISELRAFLGYGLALEITRDPHIAAAVEQMGRQLSLTVKQMELTALSTMTLSREELIEGLGVSPNTVKTRIRQLLRIHHEDTMDALGKKVLRAALAHATGSAAAVGETPVGALPVERKALARPRPGTAKAAAKTSKARGPSVRKARGPAKKTRGSKKAA